MRRKLPGSNSHSRAAVEITLGHGLVAVDYNLAQSPCSASSLDYVVCRLQKYASRVDDKLRMFPNKRIVELRVVGS